MSQAIKYESTTVDPSKSVSELMQLVQKHGGTRFEMKWDDQGRVVGIRFAVRHPKLGEVPIRLPARIAEVREVLATEKPYTYRTKRSRKQWEADTDLQAYRIAWRHLKDWVEQQLLAVRLGLLEVHEVFMSQMETRDPESGDVVTVGQLIERHGAMEPDGPMRLLRAGSEIVEADYRVEG